MVSVFTSSAVDHGFIIISMRVNPIGDVVSVFTSSAVDRGFISMRVFEGVHFECGRSWVYHHFYES